MHLIGFIIRMYHDARSSECQISIEIILCTQWPPTRFGPSRDHLQGSKIRGRIKNEITDTSLISFYLPEDDHMIGRNYEII